MYEDKTYEAILDSALGRVTNDMDKREGSIIYDAIAPSSYQLSKVYFDLDNYADLIHVDTAVDEFLDKCASDLGITRSEGESDDDLRSRIKLEQIDPAQNGNLAQYRKWAEEYADVGAMKPFPLYYGGNTLKLAIANKSRLPAEPTLVDAFQKYMDPNAEGLGNGMAHIGCKVTVVSGTNKAIDVSVNVMLSEGYTEAECSSELADAISKYLASIVFIKNSVSYLRIGSILLDCTSVSDISNLQLNGTSGDIILNGDEIPVLHGLNMAVIS